MSNQEKFLTYRDRVVFAKQTIPSFTRIPKQYTENEACFVFVNKVEIAVRSHIEPIQLNRDHALLAKCMNYFFEAKNDSDQESDGYEVMAVLIYPALVKELFDFDLSSSSYDFDFNLKRVEVDRLLENFKESISILLDHPELADENIIIGNVAFYGSSHPQVFGISGEYTPPMSKGGCGWMNDEKLSRLGGVYLWDTREQLEMPFEMRVRFPDLKLLDPINIPYQTAADVPPARIGVAIIPRQRASLPSVSVVSRAGRNRLK